MYKSKSIQHRSIKPEPGDVGGGGGNDGARL